MARLHIAEYSRMCQLSNSGPQAPEEPPIAEQVVDFTGGVTSSAAFQASTAMVRLRPDTNCCFVFSQSVSPVTATVNNQPLAALQFEYKGVKTGGQYQLSVIAS